MTYLAYKRLTTRRKNAKIEARNQQRRTLKELAERRGDTPNKGPSPGKAKTRLELRALAPTLQGSADAFTWFRDRTTKAAPNGRGWYFLTAEGWTEFGPQQCEVIEKNFTRDKQRLVKVPAGHNIVEKCVVDLDRMLVVDPILPDFASATEPLPPALPIRRVANPDAVKKWRYSLSVDEAPSQEFDANDSELLSLASETGRPCVVLYDSDRAIVVDLAKKRWVDGLFALGVDDDAEEFSGRVKKDARVTERDLPVATPVTPSAPSRYDEELNSEDDLCAQLVAMGFDRQKAAVALVATDGDVEEAAMVLSGG